MRRLPIATAALLAVLALTACSTPAPPADAVASPSATAPVPPPTPAVQVPVTQATLGPVVAPVPPVQVSIDAIGIQVPVIPVGLFNDGFMELPDDPAVAGWYEYGPTIGSPAGNTVISAHIDSPDYPIGPFASLRDVPAGAEIVVDAEDGSTARYATESVTYYLKADLPTDQVFARDGAPTLVLITCGGEFDSSTGHYQDNVVLVARKIA